MSKERRPEWAPSGAGREFASRVREASGNSGDFKDLGPRRGQEALPDIDALETGVRKGDRTLLAKAITLIESNAPRHFEAGQ